MPLFSYLHGLSKFQSNVHVVLSCKWGNLVWNGVEIFKFSLEEIGNNENKSFPLWIINQNVGVIVAARDLREHQNRLIDGMILHLCLLTNL